MRRASGSAKEAPAPVSLRFARLALLDGCLYGIEHILVEFGEKVARACLHRFDGHLNIPVNRDADDWSGNPSVIQSDAAVPRLFEPL